MFIYFIIALVVFVLDQATKWLVKTNMNLQDVIPVAGDFLAITSHRNRGAAFGILQGQQVFFIIITIVFLVGVCWYLYKMVKSGQKFVPFALSLLLGGAVGNFLDRLLYGEVVDFVQVNFDFTWIGIDYVYGFPIFNVADSGIVVGTILILLHTLIEWRREVKQEASKKAAELVDAEATVKDKTNDSV
jgi:signal peptidase II